MKKCICALVGALVVFNVSPLHGATWHERQPSTAEPNLPPGIIHEAHCKTLAPGVYDCGNHKNKGAHQNKRSGRWKIVVRPTDKVTITAQSKAERELANPSN